MIKVAGASMGAIIIDDQVRAQCINGRIDGLCNIPLDQWTSGSVAAIKHVYQSKSTLCLGNTNQQALSPTNTATATATNSPSSVVSPSATSPTQQQSTTSTSCNYTFMNSDPHLSKVRSMICMPVMFQTKVKAVLYMENNLLTDCFKSEQVNVLSILTTQVAISLENARFFESQINHMEQLAQVEKKRAMDELNYRKRQEEFVDRICHEIRNPIQGLIGNCELMDSTLRNLDRAGISNQIPNQIETLRTCIDAISVCGRYQKVITDDVLTLSKLEFNQVKLSTRPMDPRSLLDYVTKMFEADAHNKKLYLEKYILKQDCEIMVNADYNRISQILINLVSNAIKFTNQGGVKVTLNIESHQESNQKELLFSVSDSGMGIDDKNKEVIFDRFVQATQRNIQEYSGSGLGLFISKMLCELMGGKIWIENNKEGGSTFHFSIMCTQCDPNHVKDHVNVIKYESQQDVSRALNVLVVEDNKINQRVLVRLLNGMNCKCQSADDGVDGLNKFKKSHFDVILMDVSMPNMDGLECTRQIRLVEKARGDGQQVMIIGLSGNARQEHQEQGFQAGMDEYLIKPCNSKELVPLLTMRRVGIRSASPI
ncbi:hybrid signal transduction histidine kinase K [Acrasis kona]|uniref:Hybrid signal transduction histidine kinase K n=1 Tax=Acrasis kona TaxID=1008807 RepID=A0AAW2Z149_9EUKA